ncbi:MAG: molecular chaperone DnaJ [Nitritalea sp.]
MSLSLRFCLRIPLLLILLASALFLVPHAGQAQVRLGGSSSERLLQQAELAMKAGRYERANDFFREIIDNNLSIPPEMPYLFAKTLFELGQYRNAESFLAKYKEVSGRKGLHYEEALALEQALLPPLQAIQDCQLCDSEGYRHAICERCDGAEEVEQDCGWCKGRGIVGCTDCMATGIIVRKNVFNIVEYHECGRCDASGRVTCPTCEGKKLVLSTCRVCAGKGMTPTEELCNHQDSQNPRHVSLAFMRLKKQVEQLHKQQTPQESSGSY